VSALSLDEIETRVNAKIEFTCDCILGLSLCGACSGFYVPGTFRLKVNDVFMTHARGDIRALLAEVRELRRRDRKPGGKP